MESCRPKETVTEIGTTPNRSTCSSRSIRGRELNTIPDSSNINANNSNISRDNINNNNIASSGRRSLQGSFGSPSSSSSSHAPDARGSNANANVITLINNSIDFDHDVIDADRHDASTSCDVKPGFAEPKSEKQYDDTTGDQQEVAPQASPPDVMYDAPPPDDMAFYCPKQNQVFQTLKGIQMLRTDGLFTDLTVEVDGQDFKCHKFVLANSSSVLNDMIRGHDEVEGICLPATSNDGNTNNNNDDDDTNNNNKDTVKSDQLCIKDDAVNENNNYQGDGGDEGKTSETQDINLLTSSLDKTSMKTSKTSKISEEKSKILLKNVGPKIFEKILDFSYCVFDDVMNQENALDLLLAADTLKMPYLGQTAASFITETLSPSNVFDVIKLYDSGSAKLFDQRVMWKSHQVLREGFIDLASTDEFLALGANHVRDLVMDSMLHVPGEMTVLQALLRWVKSRPEERCGDLTLMLQHIRFPLMTSQELDEVRETPLLKENKLAKALVTESRYYGTLNYCDRLAWPRQNCISRRLFPTRDFIMWTADRDKGLHFFSLIDGAHHKVTSFNTATKPATAPFVFDSTSSVCAYEDRIFFSGGEFMTDKMWSVDTRSGHVSVHADMPRGRKFHSVIASHGIVYCLGGQDKRGYTVLDSVDAYIISKDAWMTAGKLAEPAYNMATVVSNSRQKTSSCGGVIYMLGGEDAGGKPLRTIQCFEWLPPRLYSAFKVEVTGMPPSLFSARTVTSGLDGLIYVVCGDGEVYKFEPEKAHLSHLTTIKNLSENPRQKFGLAHSGGRLHIIGGHQLGHSTHEPIKSVCLDIATQKEVRAHSPLLPGDNINTCVSAKLSTNTLSLFL